MLLHLTLIFKTARNLCPNLQKPCCSQKFLAIRLHKTKNLRGNFASKSFVPFFRLFQEFSRVLSICLVFEVQCLKYSVLDTFS